MIHIVMKFVFFLIFGAVVLAGINSQIFEEDSLPGFIVHIICCYVWMKYLLKHYFTPLEERKDD